MVAITDILVEIITMVNVCQGKINQNFKIDTIKQGSIMSVILSIYICLPQCSDRSSLSFWLSVCLSFCCPLSVCLSGSLIHLTDCSLIICLSVNLSVYNCFFFPFCKYRFLYSDEVQIGPETVMTTLYTAKKYAVPALEAHCVEFLKKNLRADNAFMLLTQVITVRFHVDTGNWHIEHHLCFKFVPPAILSSHVWQLPFKF